VNPDPLQPKRCAELLAALAAPERLRIIRYLRDGPRNVTEISDMLQAPVVNVSHHLHVLRHAGLVQSEKQGRFVRYSLCPGVLVPEADEQGDCINLGCCQLKVPRQDSGGQ
jgi:DNA-binding transcriptional ArsR family regulator